MSHGIEAYIMNPAQYSVIDQEINPYPPGGYEFASGNTSSVILNVHVSTGSYFLVFLDTLPSNSSAVLSAQVTETIQVSVA